MFNSEVLIDLYQKTSYRAYLGKTYVEFRVNERNRGQSWFFRSQWVTSWAFISAENPGSIRLTERTNAGKSGILLRYLRTRNMKYLLGLGIPDSADWPIELGFFVLNVSSLEASRIGCKFRQNAILFFRILKPIELIWIA
ncbi:MAG: DUF3293 domain-containing protein [Proteobacteria bacterium]|nr:DUF3293 domain-containing protein [Pseudomonadota bacterium]MDA1330887.1 DUF3293 domain-containing protein [Pseudomonadota bacterium]